MATEKIYVGNGKKGMYGIKVSINLTKLLELQQTMPQCFTSDKKGNVYFKIEINERREADQYENTHNVVFDTWVKDTAAQQSTQSAPIQKPNELPDSEKIEQIMANINKLPKAGKDAVMPIVNNYIEGILSVQSFISDMRELEAKAKPENKYIFDQCAIIAARKPEPVQKQPEPLSEPDDLPF